MRSRGRLAEVAVCPSPDTAHMGRSKRTQHPALPPPPLQLIHFTHFSDKLLPTVVSFTSSLVFISLIILSNRPFAQSGLFLFAGFMCFQSHRHHLGRWGQVLTIYLFIFLWIWGLMEYYLRRLKRERKERNGYPDYLQKEHHLLYLSIYLVCLICAITKVYKQQFVVLWGVMCGTIFWPHSYFLESPLVLLEKIIPAHNPKFSFNCPHVVYFLSSLQHYKSLCLNLTTF